MVIDKIWQKHNVTAEEVEEAIFDNSPVCIKGVSGSYWLYSHTVAGRFLFVVLRKQVGKGSFKIITAREMTEREKKYYQHS